MSYALLRRIVVGSGALTIALTTAIGGVAAADESPTTAAPTASSTPTSGEPTTSEPISGAPATSSPTTPSDKPAIKAQPHADQPVPTMDLAITFDKASYGSGDDVSGSVTIKNTGTVAAHGVHMTMYGTNLSSWSMNDPLEIWGGPGADIDAGKSLVITFTATISKPDAPIRMTADLKADPNNPNTITKEASASASITKVVGSGDGTLYFDANGNGAYDKGEGLANVGVKISGGVPNHDEPATKTDGDGKFFVKDIPAGHYSLALDGLGDLVAQSADLHIGEQEQHIFVQARHKVSDTLKAKVALNADTYAVGDIARVTVTLTNSGDHALTRITAACDRIGDPNQLTGRGDGWGDLRDGAAGITVPAHSTVTINATEAVPAGAHRTGWTAIGCDFGQFAEGFWDGAAQTDDDAFARVPGAVANVEGKLETTSAPVPGVKLYLTDHISKKITASTVTAADGSYSFTGLPAGIYDIGLVGPWKLTDGEAAWWPFFEGDNPGRNILVEAGPNQPDPAVNPTNPPTTNVPVSPAAQASPTLAYTGVEDVFSLSLAAGGALVLGVGLLLLSRRRRTS